MTPTQKFFRSGLALVVAWGMTGCGGHGDDPDAKGPSSSAPGGPSGAASSVLPTHLSLGSAPVALRAVAHHDGRFEDASQTLPGPAAFRVPDALHVERGNAGNALATLRFRDEKDGEVVTCSYRGGAGVAHPTSEHDVLAGRRYRLERCDRDGVTAGTVLSSAWFELHVEGDPDDTAGRNEQTVVALEMGEDGCGSDVLPSPLSPEDAVALRDSFSWSQTQELSDLDPQGHPSLYYARIYLRNAGDLATLEELKIHWQTMPLFRSEMGSWAGRCGQVEEIADLQMGQWVHAVIAGRTFNLLRHAALHAAPDATPPGNVLLHAVVVVTVTDAGVHHPDGSLQYDTLRAAGFHYRGQRPAGAGTPVADTAAAPAQGVVLGQQSQAFSLNPFKWAKDGLEAVGKLFLKGVGDVPKLLRDAMTFVAQGVRGLEEIVVDGLGELSQLTSGSKTQTVRLHVLNRDPAFGAGSPLVRAWGARAGQELTLPGVRVELQQWLGLFGATAPLPAAFHGDTDANGAVTLRVADAEPRDSGLCVDMATSAATMTNALLPMRVCDFRDLTNQFLRTNTEIPVQADKKELHALAQAADTYEYLRDVVGRTPSRGAEILTGWLANRFAAKGVAFTPCFGYGNATQTALWLGSSAVTFGLSFTATGPLAAVDMFWPTGNQDMVNSRGVMTHEYGHYALCSLLHDQTGWGDGAVTLSQMTWERMVTWGANRADDPVTYLNESFADLIALQVTGGANYHKLFAEGRDSRSDFFGLMKYCVAPPCNEKNFGRSIGSFEEQIARVESLFHDAFDGSGQSGNVPNNAILWQLTQQGVDTAGNLTGNTPLLYTPTKSPVQDESVALAGPMLARWVALWGEKGSSLDENNFLGSLLATVREAGYSWCQTCELFALHWPGVTPTTVESRWKGCQDNVDLRTWLGDAPEASLNLDAATCTACPPRHVSQAGVCVDCGAHTYVNGNTCATCQVNEIVVTTQCPGLSSSPYDCSAPVTVLPYCWACSYEEKPDAVNDVCVPCTQTEIGTYTDGRCRPVPILR